MTSTSTDRTHPTLILAVLSLGGIAYAMLSSSVVPALPTMQRALHASETEITWLLTAYLLSASVGTAIIGRLGDMYGKGGCCCGRSWSSLGARCSPPCRARFG